MSAWSNGFLHFLRGRILKSWVFLEFLHNIDKFLLGVDPAFVLSLIKLSKTTHYFIKTVDGKIILSMFGVVLMRFVSCRLLADDNDHFWRT